MSISQLGNRLKNDNSNKPNKNQKHRHTPDRSLQSVVQTTSDKVLLEKPTSQEPLVFLITPI